MEHSKFSFLSGCAGFVDFVFAAEMFDALAGQDQENSIFFVLDGSDWSKYAFRAPWTAISMVTFKPSGGDRMVVAVSSSGDYWELNPRSLQELTGSIKQAVFPLRKLAIVSKDIYACAMGRSVLRRKSVGDWEEIGPGTKADDDGLVVGFEDVDGFSGDEIYAVGWRGEIWEFVGGMWSLLDSPVSANLNAVCCADDDTVYIVGDDGCMLRGRGDIWEALSTERHENLMDVAYFDGSVYVTTDFHILKLQDDALIPEDAFADPNDRPATCLHLLRSADGLVSMGAKDLFRLVAGTWERVV